MTQTPRLLVWCCALLAAACGAGGNRIDPGDLELRDLLGMSSEATSSWDRDQRASARRVIEDGLHQTQASPIRVALGKDAALDRRVARALASADADRARHHVDALGLVRLAVGPGDVLATARVATIEAHADVHAQARAEVPIEVPTEVPTEVPINLRLAGWEAEPAGRQLPAGGLDVLSEIAIDAGHGSGPVVVTPAPRLAVVAGYFPATATAPARLMVNPVLLAALEPVAPEGNAVSAVNTVARSQGGGTANAQGNPYSFYGSVAECAAAQRTRCEACLADSSCTAITNLGDGNAECTQLGAQKGRGYFLICINLALAIDAVATCTQGGASSCPRDPHASESITSLENNASFLDDADCGGPLDTCLAKIYGPSQGGFPGPGPDTGTDTPPPRNTAIDCGDSCNGDSNCEASPGCELDGPSCDDSTASDGGCADSNQQSGCDSGDSGDGCSSDSGSSCDSGGDSGGDCSSGSGGDCSSDSSGDCGGGGGSDCSGGGGGDCGGGGGGGGDCNAAARHGSGGETLPIAVMWAFLPVPFAVRVRRRAMRKRAQAENAAQAPEVPS